MKQSGTAGKGTLLQALIAIGTVFAPAAFSQQVTFAPYIQLGDNGPFGPTDQIVIAWQTDEASPKVSAYNVEIHPSDGERRSDDERRAVVIPKARVVDSYLAADPALPAIAGAYGAHSNYTAVLSGLKYETEYQYRVIGPGMPAGGFTATFHTRTQRPAFSFIVVGDEGFFPVVPNSKPAIVVDYAARIAHLINNTANLSVPGAPRLPAADLIVNTGDNVYNVGGEDNYRDFFFPVYNSDADSNETGAPILRSRLFFPVDGNHDLGSTGVSANLLADNAAPAFSGNLSGGDALSYFNDFYFPQNGPAGFDIQNAWNADTSVPTGFTFSYQGHTYNSPAAIGAFRDSTKVDTGKGAHLQIDHQSNYSFDYGNAHFLFLDANPHLFNDNLPGGNAFNTPPPTFVRYPTALGQWVINDLDSSRQPWKIVVFHQPAFSSGDATIVNSQMRSIAKLLEDHGVNMVFNGHEHNYQRTLPIRATDRTAATPATTAGSPAVYVDQRFDGTQNTVPDGVLYLVEGAGGNRDFDGDTAPPRGSGVGLDQDDSATGTFVDAPGLTVPKGPASWLDTNLTNPEMINFFPNAGAGAKITAKFKSKVFSFGDVLVDRNKLTLYQISEPLQTVSSATPADPAPFGTDINGAPVNDPIPDTQVDPSTGQVVSAPATGASALLDAWTVTKPDVDDSVMAKLSAPGQIKPGQAITYTVSIRNDSKYALSGTQVRLRIPHALAFAGTSSDVVTIQGDQVVYTLGYLAVGAEQTVTIPMSVPSNVRSHDVLRVRAQLYSSTALPVETNAVLTNVR
ncbi:MAG: hypothetical protein JWO52_4453 [Gammaproteobacteria bacterium]|nr:hypothetical protein [Gammaproteobacteria bacterium]